MLGKFDYSSYFHLIIFAAWALYPLLFMIESTVSAAFKFYIFEARCRCSHTDFIFWTCKGKILTLCVCLVQNRFFTNITSKSRWIPLVFQMVVYIHISHSCILAFRENKHVIIVLWTPRPPRPHLRFSAWTVPESWMWILTVTEVRMFFQSNIWKFRWIFT